MVLQSDKIQAPHAILTRKNGVSPTPFASLNISYGVGDTPENVAQNRLTIKKLLGTKYIASSRQIHSDKIYTVNGLDRDIEVEGYDALITNRPDVSLLIQQADCQAILLHDPQNEAIGAIHCGWRGNVHNIIKSTIERMKEEFQTDPECLQAVISPSLGACCAEFIHYKEELPKDFLKFQIKPAYFDFKEISRHQLHMAGVSDDNIDIMQTCTVCDTNFFSYRRSAKNGNPVTGRQGSAICIAS